RLGTTIFLNLTDPTGQTRRVEFRQGAPGITSMDPASTLPAGMNEVNNYLDQRDSFVWDTRQFAAALQSDGSLDYTKAENLHFLHNSSNFNQTAGVLESIKQPLENRVWYNYPSQSSAFQTGSINQPS